MDWINNYREVLKETFGDKGDSIQAETKETSEEWVWINGYKGTDTDMVCRDFQYKLNAMYEMPDDEEISLCSSGFHFCKELKDVFRYYKVGSNNRFFEVRALVKRVDAENCTEKLAAKSIMLTRELDVDEILKAVISLLRPSERIIIKLDKWTDEQKKRALSIGLREAYLEVLTDNLVAYGYSRPFAAHIVFIGGYDVACAVGSQEDLSMDMKAMYIYQATMLQVNDPRAQSRNKPAYRRF